MMIHAIAPAKLNLFLHIVGRRADGYHLLESLVGFTVFGDVVRIEPSDTLTLNVCGPYASMLAEPYQNIVWKAAAALMQQASSPRGATITIEKHIPVSAGLGGGSTDAATVLKLLNQLWGEPCADDRLYDMAAALGADVPACLAAKPLMMQGTGEHITPISHWDDVPMHLLLVNPNHALPTAEVFSHYRDHGAFSSLIADPVQWMAVTQHRNDLEPSATALCPQIADVLSAIRQQTGCVMARLCGSGATCFGLFDTEQQAKQAATNIASLHGDWWVQATQLLVP